MKTLKVLGKAISATMFLNGSDGSALASQSFIGKCLLQINDKKYIDGRCPIIVENDGGFSIGASESEPVSYFAIVTVTGKDIGDGYWNEEQGASHAHTPLGKLSRNGACWSNKTARVCAWK